VRRGHRASLDDITTRARTAELLDLGIQVMLLERDDVGLLWHSLSSFYAWRAPACIAKIERKLHHSAGRGTRSVPRPARLGWRGRAPAIVEATNMWQITVPG
jgi:hypothetical protein